MKAQVSSDKEKLKEYLTFQIHRNIVNIYKQQLVLLQDIVVEHERMINKLEKHVNKKTKGQTYEKDFNTYFRLLYFIQRIGRRP